MATILHISDIHAGSPEFDSYTYRLGQHFNKILMERNVDFLVCTGDLTFKGDEKGYQKAINFFTNITKKSTNIILVPGNHDICSADQQLFTSFDIAAKAITGQDNCLFSNNSCHMVPTDEIDFYLVNSAYEGEHKYGKIDTQTLKRIVASSSSMKKRVLIAHHPFLADLNDKSSSVRNSREVLQYLAKSSFTAILHGHQHMNTRFGFKFKEAIVEVIGIRSLSLTSPDVPIGAQLVSIDNSGILAEQIDLSKDKDMTW